MATMFTNRGVGYCYNAACDDFLSGVFLLNYGATFYCPRCRQNGEISGEQRQDFPIDEGLYTKVEVHFNYNPLKREFKERAIVQIEGIPTFGVFIMKSPLVKTAARALKMAETILGALNAGMDKDNLTQQVTYTMDCSLEHFKTQMESLEKYVDQQDRRLRSYDV